jgi:hypothetical protein
VTCGARVTGDNRPSDHIVPERPLDLGHASARAEEGQLELFVLLVGGGLTGFIDLRVQLAGSVGPRFRVALWRSVANLENDGVR